MIIEFSQWGNSIGIRIPAAFAKELGITKNGRGKLDMRDGGLFIMPQADQADADFFASPVDLKALTKKITSKNKHKLVDDAPRGKETW